MVYQISGSGKVGGPARRGQGETGSRRREAGPTPEAEGGSGRRGRGQSRGRKPGAGGGRQDAADGTPRRGRRGQQPGAGGGRDGHGLAGQAPASAVRALRTTLPTWLRGSLVSGYTRFGHLYPASVPRTCEINPSSSNADPGRSTTQAVTCSPQ
jgi:hypothetical protein